MSSHQQSSPNVLMEMMKAFFGTPGNEFKVEVVGSPTQEQGHLPTSDGNEPRSLTDDDLSEFDRAAEYRRPSHVPPFGGGYTTPDELIEFLSIVDYYRYKQVVKHMNWVRKRAAKAGFPEAAIPWEKMT